MKRILALFAVIAIGLLLADCTLSSSPRIPMACTLPAGFTCVEFEVINSSGNIYLDVGQATGRNITITSFNCSDNATAPTAAAPIATAVNISNYRHAVLLNSTQNARSCCAGGTGAPCKARILFNYTTDGSNVTRQAWGDIGGAVGGYRTEDTATQLIELMISAIPFLLSILPFIFGAWMAYKCAKAGRTGWDAILWIAAGGLVSVFALTVLWLGVF